jgi:ADP-heptose:LPS heptosyltransferase
MAEKKGITYVVRLRALGDVLWIEPVVEALAKTKKKVVVFTLFPELFENFPYKNVSFVKGKKKLARKLLGFLSFFKRDILVDLNMSYEKNPKQHVLHAYQKTAQLPQQNQLPTLFLSPEEKVRFAYLKPYVVVHIETFSIRNYRNIYGIEWHGVIDFLRTKGFTVVVIGKEKPDLKDVVHFNTSIRDIIALVYNATFFIGLDSGPAHIAASLKIPSILFFGAVNPWLRHFKDSFNGIILQQPCEFAGCYHDTENNIFVSPCKLVGDEGIPKCCVHSNNELMEAVDRLMAMNNL